MDSISESRDLIIKMNELLKDGWSLAVAYAKAGVCYYSVNKVLTTEDSNTLKKMNVFYKMQRKNKTSGQKFIDYFSVN